MINTRPFSANNITVLYSFFDYGTGQNQTVDMRISAKGIPGSGKTLFNTNYQSNDSDDAYTQQKPNPAGITFRAGLNNSGVIDLEFYSPLQIAFNQYSLFLRYDHINLCIFETFSNCRNCVSLKNQIMDVEYRMLKI